MRRKETKENFPQYVHGETFTTSERLLFGDFYNVVQKTTRWGGGEHLFHVVFFATAAFIYFANDICRVHWSFK